MEQTVKNNVQSLMDNVSAYVEQRKDLLVLDATEKSSKILSHLIANILIAALGGLVLLFASIGVAWLIGQSINNVPMGFLFISLFYILLLVITLIINKRILQVSLINYFIKKMLYATNDQ